MRLRRIGCLLLCVALLSTAANTPRPAPDFTVNMADGSQLALSQYRGKVVVMAFLLTYCAHCQKTTQVLSKLQREYGPRGLQVVGSAVEDMARMAVPDFIRKFQPAFPVGYNLRDAAIEYLQHPVMFRLMMPQVVVIDRAGMIRAQMAGDDAFFSNEEQQESNFRKLLDPLLNEGPSPRKSPVAAKAGKPKTS